MGFAVTFGQQRGDQRVHGQVGLLQGCRTWGRAAAGDAAGGWFPGKAGTQRSSKSQTQQQGWGGGLLGWGL